jgi:F-type H+-transporting ATPase subunit a
MPLGSNLLAAGNPLEHVVDHVIFKTESGWWLLSNHMVMMFVAAGLMLLIFPAITRRYRSGEWVPTGTRNFFEAILVYLRDEMVKPLLGHHTTAFMPYFWTLFFFILFCNLLGLLPLDVITGFGLGLNHGHGVFGTATSNIWVTGALALLSFIMIQANGIRANGISGWAHHFLGGAPWWLAPIMIPVEFLGMLIKPFALMVRLFANMTAGHVLLAVLIGFVPAAFSGLGTAGATAIGLISIISAVAIMLLEIFVAFLQAYLFTFLTALFISQMMAHEEGHTEGDEQHGDVPAHGTVGNQPAAAH